MDGLLAHIKQICEEYESDELTPASILADIILTLYEDNK